MTKNELVALEVEKRALRETSSNFNRNNCDFYMWDRGRDLMDWLDGKADKLQKIIDENYDSATD